METHETPEDAPPLEIEDKDIDQRNQEEVMNNKVVNAVDEDVKEDFQIATTSPYDTTSLDQENNNEHELKNRYNLRSDWVPSYTKHSGKINDSGKLIYFQQNEKRFGESKVKGGNEQTFLGMNIKINDDRSVCIDTSIKQFPETISQSVTSPATSDIFDINKKAEKIGENRQDIFHSLVAKLLWEMKRGRPDIELLVSLICTTRVQALDTDDWSKSRRVIQFLHGTKDDVRQIGAINLSTLLTHIGAS